MSDKHCTSQYDNRSAVADLINHWQRVIHRKAFNVNGVSEIEAYKKLGYYEGMYDQICKEKRK